MHIVGTMNTPLSKLLKIKVKLQRTNCNRIVSLTFFYFGIINNNGIKSPLKNISSQHSRISRLGWGQQMVNYT